MQLFVDLFGLIIEPICDIGVLLVAMMVLPVVATSIALLDRQQLLVLVEVRGRAVILESIHVCVLYVYRDKAIIKFHRLFSL